MALIGDLVCKILFRIYLEEFSIGQHGCETHVNIFNNKVHWLVSLLSNEHSSQVICLAISWRCRNMVWILLLNFNPACFTFILVTMSLTFFPPVLRWPLWNVQSQFFFFFSYKQYLDDFSLHIIKGNTSFSL